MKHIKRWKSSASQALAIGTVLSLSACGGGGGGSGGDTPPPGQPSGTTINSSDGSSSITVTPSNGTVTEAKSLKTPASAPSNYNYPTGFYTFSITGLTPGASVTVTISTPAGTNPTDYIKCDSSLLNCARFSQALISGNNIVLTLQDGGPGDEDGQADGTITDPGAPAVALAAPAASYYIPFEAYGDIQNTYTGQLLVAPSNAPTASPTTVLPYGLDFAQFSMAPVFNADGQVYSYDPSTAYAVYSTNIDSTGAVYRLDLNNTGAAPQSTQLTSFVLNSSYRCDASPTPEDPADVSSWHYLLSFAGADGQCYTADDEVYDFLPSDTPDTAPHRITAIDSLDMEAFYQGTGESAPLAGIVAPQVNGDVEFFSDLSFTNPKLLMSGETGDMLPVYYGDGYIFVTLTDSSGITSLYRVDATGTISQPLYQFQGAYSFYGSLVDPTGTTLFFSDDLTNYDADGYVTSYSDKLVKVALDGSAPATTLYSVADTMPSGSAYPVVIQLNGFIDDALIFAVQAYGRYGHPGYPALLASLPIAASMDADPSQPTTIASLDGGYFGLGVVVDHQIAVNLHTVDATGNETSLDAEVIKADGSLVKSYPDSEFLGELYQPGGQLPELSTTPSALFLAKSYTATPLQSGDYSFQNLGGATMTRLSPADLSEQSVLLADGTPYVLASGEDPDFYDSTGLPVTGQSVYSYVNHQQDAALYDAKSNTWYPTAGTTDTSVYPLYLFDIY